MTTTDPFSSTELTAMKVLAELHKDDNPSAAETLRLIRMIEARDLVIRQLNEVSDAWQSRALAAEHNLQAYVFKLAIAMKTLWWFADHRELAPDIGLEARKSISAIQPPEIET